MAHGYLSYQQPSGEVDYLSMIYRRIKEYLDKREKKTKTPDEPGGKLANIPKPPAPDDGGPVQEVKVEVGSNTPPSSHSAKQNLLKGSSFSALAGADRKALPGQRAINPDVVGMPPVAAAFGGKRLTAENYFGDAIVDIGATNLGVEKDLGGDDMFIKRLNGVDDGIGGGSEQIVQSIDRLTFVTMSLVAATKEQTQQQGMIAAAQQQQAEKLAAQSKAAAEESAMEMGGDLSGNLSYQQLLAGGGAAIAGRGSNRGGGPGAGVGGKAMIKNVLQAGVKRGGGRAGTRLGAALGGKLAGGLGKKMGAKLGATAVGKVAGGALAKSLGKKIPLVGLGLGAVFAAQRAMQGDFIGAGLELASGAASTVPGIGTAGSVGIDAALAARDVMSMQDGGIPLFDNQLIQINDRPDKKREAVMPLTDKTFLSFGEGILEAQKRNKLDSSRVLAAGLSEYYDKQSGWDRFLDGLKSILPDMFKGLKDFKWPWERDDRNGNRRGSGATSGNINAADIDADSPEAKALVATIREVEGTAHAKGYDTWFGGRNEMKMTEMTLQEVYDEQTRRMNAGETTYNGLSSAAVGVGQFMDPLNQARAMYAARGEEFDPTKIKFDEKLQNELLLDLAARKRGIDVTKPLTLADFEILQKEWAGLGTFHGQTKRTTADSLRIYQENLKEANENKPTPPETPPTPPAAETGDRRQTDASQRISRNFGRKSGEAINFVHKGEKYHAVKTTNGWDIYKGAGGIFGDQYRVQTSDGKNSDVVDSFINQAESGGGYRVPDGETESVEEHLSRLSSATADDSTAVAAKSQELAMATTSSAGTTVINNYVTQGSDGKTGGNTPANVPIGPTSGDMGVSVFSELALRNS